MICVIGFGLLDISLSAILYLRQIQDDNLQDTMV
ncbi:hypothetical protein C8R28_103742 [Nitrosomonas ureae]|uniref:Uncharacterized protein n=1 Tax=Nitrosomonas ureae TaxID=44577 RepID=A0A2T5I9Z0_9PROT|nr:hypothetical protein C8R28_103742 [Nitrosomonas ureae]